MEDTADFLRHKARQCRQFAAYHAGEPAGRLIEMADELDAKARQLEQTLYPAVAELLMPSQRRHIMR